jgi:hypothetical protein
VNQGPKQATQGLVWYLYTGNAALAVHFDRIQTQIMKKKRIRHNRIQATSPRWEKVPKACVLKRNDKEP